MSTSPSAAEVARPHQGDLPSTLTNAHANLKINPNQPESPRELGRSPNSSDDPSSNTTLLGTAKKSGARLSRRDTGGKDAKDKKDTENANGRPGPQVASPLAIDPLTHHIFSRTNTERSIASRFRNPVRPDSPANEALPRPSSDLSSRQVAAQPDISRDKRYSSNSNPRENGVASRMLANKKGGFLSRLSMIGGKKKEEGIPDDESELSELRTEGANAVVFSSAIGAGGYIPHHKEPPRYIRVRAQNKKVKEFNRMFLAQELVGTQRPAQDDETKTTSGTTESHVSSKEDSEGGPIWAVEFSKDGRYMATGGRDRVVRIWAVLATQEDRKAYAEEEKATNDKEQHLSAPVFRAKPIREFVGHTGEILDLSWSKNNFLLSSSMDKTVRLWHISRQECLCTFKHKDFVTSIAFHPRDDRFFLAGSLDSYLRLWSIPDKAVAYSSQLSDFITAVAFSPDGKTALAGCINGLCMFYETEGLKYLAQIHVRSSRGKNAKGSKITGIEMMRFPPNAPDGILKVLITSNDSRIRIYDFSEKNLDLKLKGHENACSQIRATFSDDGSYIICGSEDKRAFIWSTSPRLAENKEKRPCEYFEAHSHIVTGAIFAPTTTRQLLQTSEDPIFTLCNPPPITLLSKEESAVNPVNQTVESQDVQSEASSKLKRPDESPGFISRSTHYDGNIVITTDHAGLIKIFRQDCAFVKRRHDNWDTASTFSRKLGRDGLLGRSGSIVTKISTGSRDPHSRRGSLTQPIQAVFQANSDRINTWRHGVEGHPGRPVSISISTPARSERSLSPSKAARTPVNPASEARRQPYTHSSMVQSPASPTASLQTNKTNDRSGLREPTLPPTPSFSFRPMDEEEDDLRLDPAGASYAFWNLNKWRNVSQQRSIGNPPRGISPGPKSPLHNRSASAAPASGNQTVKDARRRTVGSGSLLGLGEGAKSRDHATTTAEESERRRRSVPAEAVLLSSSPSPPPEHKFKHKHNGSDSRLLPPSRPIASRMDSFGSRLSRLSSEVATSEEQDDDDEGEDMQCPACGHRTFRAKKMAGKQKLLCGKCGRAVDS